MKEVYQIVIAYRRQEEIKKPKSLCQRVKLVFYIVSSHYRRRISLSLKCFIIFKENGLMCKCCINSEFQKGIIELTIQTEILVYSLNQENYPFKAAAGLVVLANFLSILQSAIPSGLSKSPQEVGAVIARHTVAANRTIVLSALSQADRTASLWSSEKVSMDTRKYIFPLTVRAVNIELFNTSFFRNGSRQL